MAKSFRLLGTKINVTNPDSACEEIESWITNGIKSYVCVAPVSTVVDCCYDKDYREVVNGSSMTTPDGMPVVWSGKLKGYKEIARTYGPDLMLRLCYKGQEKGYRHYFYGGSKESISLLIKNFKERFPKINIVGSYSPPMMKLHERENDSIVRQINDAKADILWVGLGSPKQDFWMAEHRGFIDSTVMIGVGAAFDFHSGMKKQAPVWMRKSGLEWLFRLISEPRRLWRRYLVGNTMFILLSIKEAVVSVFSRKK